MLAGLRFLVRSKPVVPCPERLSPKPDGAFLCARHHQTKGVSYVLVRVLVLDQVLDRGLDPGAVRWAPAASTGGGASYPGGFLSHTVWFVRGRLRRAAQRRAFAKAEKAEEEEYRRLRRRRSPQGDTSVPSLRGELTR